MKIYDRYGEILYNHRGPRAPLAQVLEAAHRAGVNLRGADLAGVDLTDVSLAGAYLFGASLVSANLTGANLAGADLAGADLRCANLTGANMCGANLEDANLAGAVLDCANLAGANLEGEILAKTPISITGLAWPVLITEKHMRIGCQRYPHSAWASFSDAEIRAMAPGAAKFWRQWRGALLTMCIQHGGDSS